LIAERNPDTHESHLYELTWKEIDQQLKASRQASVMSEAAELGVQLND